MFNKNKNENKNKNIKEESLIFKENSHIMTYGEKYYHYIDKIKKEIKKEKKYTYIHFRAKNNYFNPESNMANGIFPIIKTNQIFNLKDEECFQEIIKSELHSENIDNEEIHAFLKMFIHQVYKCIKTKYYHKEKINLSNIFESLYDFKNLFSKYNQYTESNIHDNSIEEYISVMYGLLKIKVLLKNIEKKLNIIHSENFNIIETLSQNPIELFDTTTTYNETLFYLLYKKIVSDLHILSKSKKDSGLNKDKIYIIFDNYPLGFIREPYFYSQLRALGIRLVFPKSEDLSFCEYLNSNSIPFDLD